MKPIRFSPRADIDLVEIAAYYERIAPDVLARIRADIERGLDLIKDYPERTALVSGTSYRRHVTSRYRFKIAYRVHTGHIAVLGIYRFQNRIA